MRPWEPGLCPGAGAGAWPGPGPGGTRVSCQGWSRAGRAGAWPRWPAGERPSWARWCEVRSWPLWTLVVASLALCRPRPPPPPPASPERTPSPGEAGLAPGGHLPAVLGGLRSRPPSAVLPSRWAQKPGGGGRAGSSSSCQALPCPGPSLLFSPGPLVPAQAHPAAGTSGHCIQARSEGCRGRTSTVTLGALSPECW